MVNGLTSLPLTAMRVGLEGHEFKPRPGRRWSSTKENSSVLYFSKIHYEQMYVNSRVIGMCVLIEAVQPDHAPPLRIRSDFMNNILSLV